MSDLFAEDIVHRLRREGHDAFARHYSMGMWQLCMEAADEITRLRNQIATTSSVPSPVRTGEA